MNEYERFFASINLEKPDRVPISLWTHAYNKDIGVDFRSFARNGEVMAKAHLAFLNKYEVDFLKVTPCGLFFLEDWGGRIDYHNETASVSARVFSVKETEDWEKLEVLDPRKAELHKEQLRCLNLLNKKIGGKIPFVETLFNPLTTAVKLAGMDQVRKDMQENPGALKKGLETISLTLSEFIKKIIEEGASGIFYSIKMISRDSITSKEFDEFNLKFDLSLFKKIDPDCILLHIHTDIPSAEILLDKIPKYSVNGINWWDKGTNLDLTTAREKFSKKFCLISGIDHKGALLGTPELIEDEVESAINEAGIEGGFMLGPGCVMDPSTTERNIFAAIRAAKKYGKY